MAAAGLNVVGIIGTPVEAVVRVLVTAGLSVVGMIGTRVEAVVGVVAAA